MPEFEVCSWNENADDRECESAQLRERIAELKRERGALAAALKARIVTREEKARAEMQERCAKLCEGLALPRDTEWWQATTDCAKAIRALGDE